MSKPAKFVPEGGSSNRPPYFDGTDYYYWKGKMRLFLISQDNYMWPVVESGNFVPMTTATETAPSVAKPQAEWSKDENDKVLLNSKAQLFLTCALSREEYDRIEECTTAKEIWDALKVHHEGTSHVKEERIDMGVKKFETFEMKENETIDEMFARLTIIVNELRSLGKTYSTHERVRKILRSLPKVWRPMVTAITQAKNLKELQLEELVGSLRAHEAILMDDKPLQKNKMVALKTSQNYEEQEGNTSSQNLESHKDQVEPHSEDEDELALISRRIQRMVFKRNQNRRPFQNRREPQRTEIDKSKVNCFGCNKPGHYKSECPLEKRNKPQFQKRSLLATWDDADNSNEGIEDEEANLCLMAKDNTEEVIFSNSCSSCKKVEIFFDNLLKDSETLSQKCLLQRNQLIEIKKQNEELQKRNEEYLQTIQNLKLANLNLSEQKEVLKETPLETFEEENDLLKVQVEELTNDITNFVKSTETFQKIMGSQAGMFDKAGIGFNVCKNQKIYKNFFIPKQDKKVFVPNIKKECTFCRNHGHIEKDCFHKRNKSSVKRKCYYCGKTNHQESECYLKKRKRCSYCNKTGHHEFKCYSKNKSFKNANTQGPKSMWVPKLLLTSETGIHSGNQEKALVLGQWLLKAYDRG